MKSHGIIKIIASPGNTNITFVGSVMNDQYFQVYSCVGASIANPNRLFFCVIGDLATFYDMNVIGNRHIGNNLRIIVSNNGAGYEMHCPGSIGENSDLYFAAGGHYGNKSRKLLKNFAENLGFEYISAESKEEYLSHQMSMIDQ